MSRRPGEPAGHCHDHDDVHHRFVILRTGLVIADATAVLADPRDGPLNHPPAGKNRESGGVGGALDHLDRKSQNVFRPDRDREFRTKTA